MVKKNKTLDLTLTEIEIMLLYQFITEDLSIFMIMLVLLLNVVWRQGVEPVRCASFANAMKHGKPVYTPTEVSLADGLTVPTVGCNALATAGQWLLLKSLSNNRHCKCKEQNDVIFSSANLVTFIQKSAHMAQARCYTVLFITNAIITGIALHNASKTPPV